MVTRFQELICWQKAFDLSNTIYEATIHMRDFGLRDQLRRASISTMNNIAEGFGKIHRKEMGRYLEYTTASCLEIESMTYLLERQQILNVDIILSIRNKAIECYKVTAGFSKSLK